jgi:NAD+ synthase (glutamine-hydrolysing)
MIRIALAQTNLTVGDIRGNCAKIKRWIDRVRRRQADLVVFPELAVSGYPAEDLLLKQRFLDDCRSGLEMIAPRADGPAAIVGYPSRSDATFNSAAVLAEGRVITVFHKILLPNYGVFDEDRYFTPGRNTVVLRLGQARIGVSICEDIWREDIALAQARRGGAGILLNLSSSPYHTGKGAERQEMLRRRALRTGTYVAYANLVGGQDELVFDGQSMVVAPDGEVLARGRQFSEDMVIADLDTDVRSPGSPSPDRIPVEVVTVPHRPPRPRKKARMRKARTLDPLAETYEAVVSGCRDYVGKNGFERVVIGLSGGIDSSLVAAMAVDALGADCVTGVAMPSPFSSPGSLTDARRLARNLKVRLIRVDIERAYQAYLDLLQPVFKGRPFDVTEENLQARVRGNILMALSNKFGWLVLTTGNKSELAVGYCTLYGDLAGGFALLKDVPKTLVYRLAAFRNSREEVIPRSVMTKPPSAELRPNQKDEDSLPPYEVLDAILHMYVVEDLGISDIVSAGYPRDLVTRVVRMVDGNEYKRRQGPPGVKITPRAFGKDRRMPITNRYL